MVSSIDLATLNTARVAIMTPIRNQCCQWEQDSTEAATRSIGEQVLDALACISTARINAPHPKPVAQDHLDAPKQFGIRLSQETLELISAIQEFRKRTNQPITDE